jgi:hypothetical protein
MIFDVDIPNDFSMISTIRQIQLNGFRKIIQIDFINFHNQKIQPKDKSFKKQ